ncbi:MAG: ribosome-associated translation inhibitor RaiA [Anaerolineae bacterium]|nr:ribosome-associated translation inhibitor RaiA [Anaerolineae bacterium]
MAMAIDIHSSGLDVGERLFEYITTKSEKLDRYIKGINELRVDLTHVKTARDANDRFVAQITLQGKGFVLRAEERADDVFVAFDNSLDKLKRRIDRYKGKRYRGRGDGTSIKDSPLPEAEIDYEEIELPIIARRKKFLLLPMDENEAIEQMNLLGHEDFFVFFNVETNAVNLLYRRRDDSYGLIETELG